MRFLCLPVPFGSHGDQFWMIKRFHDLLCRHDDGNTKINCIIILPPFGTNPVGFVFVLGMDVPMTMNQSK